MPRRCKWPDTVPFARLMSCMAALVLAACATHRAFEATAPPPAVSFDRELVARGDRLASLGNCASCHTAADGKPYAGGFPVHTPFGTVYGTNITPDVETGIGKWSLAAFERAMREGIDREGHHLYPAFPYEHFTLVSNDDIAALYAFVMTREPVASRPPANTISVPRPLVAIWKSLYFEPGRFHADPAHDAQWNRGASLADGLAHCGACHTPHNTLGAEKKAERYAGGEVSGWHGPALDANSSSPIPWTEEALAQYLRNGVAPDHALAAGPMANVVRNLSHGDPQDIQAIAHYIASLDARPASARAQQAQKVLAELPRPGIAKADARHTRGEQVYAAACAECHDRGRGVDGGALPMPLAIAITLPTPSNLVHIVRDGIVPREHEHGLWMPPFDAALTDEHIAELATYLRSMTDLPPWRDVPGDIRKLHTASR
ncbi:MAG: cytochrome c [Burkholderiales bacterium]|nr:cytochrome c [Burkholderiales bacterium]